MPLVLKLSTFFFLPTYLWHKTVLEHATMTKIVERSFLDSCKMEAGQGGMKHDRTDSCSSENAGLY